MQLIQLITILAFPLCECIPLVGAANAISAAHKAFVRSKSSSVSVPAVAAPMPVAAAAAAPPKQSGLSRLADLASQGAMAIAGIGTLYTSVTSLEGTTEEQVSVVSKPIRNLYGLNDLFTIYNNFTLGKT